jgi:hypothetical protein
MQIDYWPVPRRGPESVGLSLSRLQAPLNVVPLTQNTRCRRSLRSVCVCVCEIVNAVVFL